MYKGWESASQGPFKKNSQNTEHIIQMINFF